MVVAVKRCLVGISVRSCTTGGQDAFFMLCCWSTCSRRLLRSCLGLLLPWVSCMWSLSNTPLALGQQ